MRIPACVPRLPPGLLSAWALDYCTTRWVVKKRKKKAQKAKAKSPDGLAGKVKVFLFTPGDIPRYDCKIIITSGRRRAVIEIMPGGTSKHDPIPGKQLVKAMYKHCHGSWPCLPFRRYRTFKYIAALVRNQGERGLIHNLTESDDDISKVSWWAFRHRFCVPQATYPFVDLGLSNLITKDIYLSLPGDGLPIEPALKLQLEAQMTWNKEVFIERPLKRPGVVRICPVGQYIPAEVARKVNGVYNTKFHFGTTILTGDKTFPIEVDIMEMVNKFFLYLIGQIGSGKTNLWKQLLQDATDMINNGIVSEGWFFDPSEKKAAGLRHLESKKIQFAVTPERTVTLMREIRQQIIFRNKRMEEINQWREKNKKPPISEWPIGQTFALPGQQPELYTAKLIMADEFLSFSKDLIENIWLPWAKTIRSLGFVIIVGGVDFRVNTGIPGALLRCFDARMSLRMRDGGIGGEFFKGGPDLKFSRDPTKLSQGQFVIDLPCRGLDLQYGITKHIPDEDAQAA